MFEYLACYCTCDVKLFGSLPVPVDADPLGRPGSGVQREVVSKLGIRSLQTVDHRGYETGRTSGSVSSGLIMRWARDQLSIFAG